MDKDQLLELAPHYIAMLLLVFFILEASQAVVGEIGFWLELVLILVIVFVYRLLVVQLGIAPSSWE
jgi:amino acid permease